MMFLELARKVIKDPHNIGKTAMDMGSSLVVRVCRENRPLAYPGIMFIAINSVDCFDKSTEYQTPAGQATQQGTSYPHSSTCDARYNCRFLFFNQGQARLPERGHN
jgi:hypothetical protein